MIILCGPFSKATPGDIPLDLFEFFFRNISYKQHLNTPLFIDLSELDGASVRGSCFEHDHCFLTTDDRTEDVLLVERFLSILPVIIALISLV